MKDGGKYIGSDTSFIISSRSNDSYSRASDSIVRAWGPVISKIFNESSIILHLEKWLFSSSTTSIAHPGCTISNKAQL